MLAGNVVRLLQPIHALTKVAPLLTLINGKDTRLMQLDQVELKFVPELTFRAGKEVKP
jgi:hypothetical protein